MADQPCSRSSRKIKRKLKSPSLIEADPQPSAKNWGPSAMALLERQESPETIDVFPRFSPGRQTTVGSCGSQSWTGPAALREGGSPYACEPWSAPATKSFSGSEEEDFPLHIDGFKANLRAQNLKQRQQYRRGHQQLCRRDTWCATFDNSRVHTRTLAVGRTSPGSKAFGATGREPVQSWPPSRKQTESPPDFAHRQVSCPPCFLDEPEPMRQTTAPATCAYTVGKIGSWRASMNDMWQPDLLEKHVFKAFCNAEFETCLAPTAESRLDVIIGFVARRIYRRLRHGSALLVEPPLLEQFNEHRFQPQVRVQDENTRCTRSVVSRVCCLFSRGRGQSDSDVTDVMPLPSPIASADEVFDFTQRLVTWCAIPTDLVVIALVYMDKLLDQGRDKLGRTARGVLTPRSWRPVLIACTVLASKVWEDICITNIELAEFARFTQMGVLRLELLTMDAIGWNVNISAELFAPYFWAAHKLLVEGTDDDELV